ncbi:MAG: helix-hairpin-helix domain-containing protein [bacterium]
MGLPRSDTTPTKAPEKTGVEVKIIGEGIKNPGRYELSADSTITDLIKRAGGLNKGAITDGLRWNQKLYKGLTLTIPTRRALRNVRSGTRTLSNKDLIRFRPYKQATEDTAESTKKIDLNNADRETLKELPGIGPVLADRIIDYRQREDGFDTVRNITVVVGIGEATYEELRARLTVH